MRDFLQKNKFVLSSIIAGVLIVGGTGTLFYYQTKVSSTCEKKLESYGDNHLCMNTSKGVMIFELYPDATPKAVERMKKLSNDDKFYDGLEFYRVLDGFVVQGGVQDFAARVSEYEVKNADMKAKVDLIGKDAFSVETNFEKLGFTAEQAQALSDQGYISDSKLNTRKFEYGSIAFANNGAEGNSTEFFIVNAKEADENTANLEGKYSNFGKLIEGQDVLDAISKTPRDPNYPLEFSQDQSKPVERIEIYESRAK
jgi:peptidylprolyl isomerase